MHIRLINPNTTSSMTEKIDGMARRVVAPGTHVEAVSPRFGPASIEGHHDEAIAVLGVLDEIRRGEIEGCDGYVVACFGDPGIAPARELAVGPVVGIAEAAMRAASFLSEGFTIISMMHRSRVGLEHLVRSYGMERHCRRVRTTDIPVLDLEHEGSDARARILREARCALDEDHSDCIILGCAGLTDLTAHLEAELGVPVIDGVTVATKQVELLVQLGLRTAKRQGYAMPIEKQVIKGTPAVLS